MNIKLKNNIEFYLNDMDNSFIDCNCNMDSYRILG